MLWRKLQNACGVNVPSVAFLPGSLWLSRNDEHAWLLVRTFKVCRNISKVIACSGSSDKKYTKDNKWQYSVLCHRRLSVIGEKKERKGSAKEARQCNRIIFVPHRHSAAFESRDHSSYHAPVILVQVVSFCHAPFSFRVIVIILFHIFVPMAPLRFLAFVVYTIPLHLARSSHLFL